MVEATCLVFLVTVLLAASSCALDQSLDEDWITWKSLHGKQYPAGAEAFRRAVWEKNLQMIERHNLEHKLGKQSYSLKINHFGDLVDEEFEKLMNGALPEPFDWHQNMPVFQNSRSFNGPKEVNWASKGYVTPVKNQGRCGSCWAFSATGALEGQVFNKTGQLVSLSEQNLLDCSKNLGNMGCNGGYPNRAFEYVRRNGGINSEDHYPYEGRDDETCRYNPMQKAGNCSSFFRVLPGSEAALEEAVASVGPVSVAVYSSLSNFIFYSSGVYYDTRCTKSVNHAMLVVGYSTTQEKEMSVDYWLIKNSWSEHWGEQGYMRLKKGADNQCGIANQAYFPIL